MVEFAGHRSTRFKFKYKEDYSLCKKIKKKITEQLKYLYDEKGVRRIYVGGSLGVDIWVERLFYGLKETSGYEYCHFQGMIISGMRRAGRD